MATIEKSKKIKSYPDPKDESPMTKYYLGWGQYQDQSKQEFLRARINGYLYELEFGKLTMVPENIIKLIENARIRYVKNSSLSRYEHGVGGTGRPQGEIMHPSVEMADIPMYNLVRQ